MVRNLRESPEDPVNKQRSWLPRNDPGPCKQAFSIGLLFGQRGNSYQEDCSTWCLILNKSHDALSILQGCEAKERFCGHQVDTGFKE